MVKRMCGIVLLYSFLLLLTTNDKETHAFSLQENNNVPPVKAHTQNESSPGRYQPTLEELNLKGTTLDWLRLCSYIAFILYNVATLACQGRAAYNSLKNTYVNNHDKQDDGTSGQETSSDVDNRITSSTSGTEVQN